MGELDVAVKWGPFLVLIEAKAKQFRLASQLGDAVRLRSDLKANLEDAFTQAQRAKRYLSTVDLAVFTETTTGKELRVRARELEGIFLLTVSQHYLSGLALRFAALSNLGLFRAGEYPISMSIADLDTITDVCEAPDVLLHYVARRKALQHLPGLLRTDELELFGFYLDTRFQVTHLWDRKSEEPFMLSIGGYQDSFDAWMQYKRGLVEAPPEIKLQVPEEIREVLDTLRHRSGEDARRLSFTLLDLPGRALNEIANRIRKLRGDPPPPGILFRRAVFRTDDMVVAIVATTSQPLLELERNLTLRLAAEKYRHRGTRAVGIGLRGRERLTVASVLELEGPWQEDAEMEALLTSEPVTLWRVPEGQKLPGRNAPCICGSGRKFKHCCLTRVQKSRH